MTHAKLQVFKEKDGEPVTMLDRTSLQNEIQLIHSHNIFYVLDKLGSSLTRYVSAFLYKSNSR